MRKLAPFLLVLLLAGCVSSTGRGSRLLPWNWFSPDNATKLEHQQDKTGAAERKLVGKAQENVRATGKTIARLPDGLLKQVLAEFNDRADAELADAIGPLSPETDRSLATLVEQLTSENAELRAKGEAALAKRDRIEEVLGKELEEAREREKQLTEKLKTSDLNYQAEAEQARRWKFWIAAAIGSWLLLQLLSGLSRFYPGLAPVSHFAGTIAAPAMRAAYTRVTAAAGRAIAAAEKVSADAAATIRNHLDTHADAADQVEIRKHYEAASRT